MVRWENCLWAYAELHEKRLKLCGMGALGVVLVLAGRPGRSFEINLCERKRADSFLERPMVLCF